MRHQGRALKIISAVVHPLWLDEFYEVASVEISDTTVSLSETINSVNDLLGCYGNLVYLHKNHCTSHFVYYSIRQFFRGEFRGCGMIYYTYLPDVHTIFKL